MTAQLGNATLSLTGQGRVFRINDNGGKRFAFRRVHDSGSRPRERWIGGKYFQGHEHWIADASGDESAVLVSPKTTDVLRIKATVVPPGIALNPTSSARVRAAYYSAASLLIRAAALELDVDSDEIEIASIHGGPEADPTFVGEVMLGDRSANGAGFVEWVIRNWNGLTDQLVHRTGRFGKTVCKCDSACYRCLLAFRNRPLHALLDWRLGLDLISIWRDARYRCGLSGFDSWTLHDWPTRAVRARDSIVKAFPATPIDDLPLPGFVTKDATLYLITHPLWSDRGLMDMLSEVPATSFAAFKSMRAMNTFDLERRMAWCWQNRVAMFPAVEMPTRTVRVITQPLHGLPEASVFVLAARPRGLPDGRTPKFTRIAANDRLVQASVYLVKTPDGEFVAARVARFGESPTGRYRALPANHEDGAPSFYADRSDIVAILTP